MKQTIVRVPKILEHECGGLDSIRLSGADVRALLGEMSIHYPKLYRSLCNERNEVRRHIHLFVNQTWIGELNGLDTRLGVDDSLFIFQAVSGG
jgi:sulfur-carrier protein